MVAGLVVFLRCGMLKGGYANDNLYQKGNYGLEARLIVYHINDSISQLFFSFPNDNLIYKRPDTSSLFYARVKVNLSLPGNNKLKKTKDSVNVLVYDRQPEKVFSKLISGSLKFKVKLGQFTEGDVTIYDLNKKQKNVKFVEIDKTSRFTRQNFLMKTKSGELIYTYYLHGDDEVFISSEQNNQPGLRVDYFNRHFPMARPCYSLVEREAFDYKPDSSFIIAKKDNDYKITLPERGFYHIITSNESREGLTLYTVENAFPGIKNEDEMIRSSRYIMQTREFDYLTSSPNKKEAIDDFWKDKGGSNERAKELLKKYYNRVVQANKLFTSYIAGWQTDRGMIYIVFGTPGTMYKIANGEQWIYGNEAEPNAVRFNFKKNINPFTDNDFILERSEYLKKPWHDAVTYWREGRVYLDN
jgi:GWxTD domain-containing protein